MSFVCLTAGWYLLARGLIAVGLWMAWSAPGHAAGEFPFDRELVLDAAPMPPVKRVPVLTVADDGRATVDLWCRTVAARVLVSDNSIRIETAPLPESLPQYRSEGQCSEIRVQADTDMLRVLAQVTEWRKQGRAIVLVGATTLKFRPSDH